MHDKKYRQQNFKQIIPLYYFSISCGFEVIVEHGTTLLKHCHVIHLMMYLINDKLNRKMHGKKA